LLQHRRGPLAAAIALAALAALVATAPAPAAETAAGARVLGACNPFIASQSAAIGSMETARSTAVAARGGTIAREPAIDTSDTEITGPSPRCPRASAPRSRSTST